jgi:hypothetical protein
MLRKVIEMGDGGPVSSAAPDEGILAGVYIEDWRTESSGESSGVGIRSGVMRGDEVRG